jgi:hypothetical protein
MHMNRLILITGVMSLSATLPAFAGTACDEVKAQIVKKLEAHGVKAYTLDAVATADVKEQQVVGSCEGGSKKIVYQRGAAKVAAPVAPAAPAPAAAPAAAAPAK